MVSSRPHNFFDTASYAKPLRFQINLATFLNSIQKHFEKICPLGNSTGTFWGKNSKMAKLAKTAVIWPLDFEIQNSVRFVFFLLLTGADRPNGSRIWPLVPLLSLFGEFGRTVMHPGLRVIPAAATVVVAPKFSPNCGSAALY